MPVSVYKDDTEIVGMKGADMVVSTSRGTPT